MSFLGGAECSTAGNPLSQFTKHVQDDKSLQRDRLVGQGPGDVQETFRSRQNGPNQDEMMQNFLHQNGQIPQDLPQPFAMDQMRRDLDGYRTTSPRIHSPNWATEFDPGEQARMEAAFQAPKSSGLIPSGLSSAEFQKFQRMERIGAPRISSPPTRMSMGIGSYPTSTPYMGMDTVGFRSPPSQRDIIRAQQQLNAKGKGRMTELDDKDWEQQFREMDAAGQQDLDAEANLAMERDLDEMDRSVLSETNEFGDFESVWRGIQAETEAARLMESESQDGMHMGDDIPINGFDNWENFDSAFQDGFRDPQLGNYLFEEDNPFMATSKDPFSEGLKIVEDGGNLSLAALAFEAAVQKDPQHVEAWCHLGGTQAQNEKESPAIRALEQALKLDPSNLSALMGLAISYTNEGYDSTAYRTLERWLATKYPQVISQNDLTPEGEMGFTDRHILHAKVTDLFIRAAQLSPDGEHMDPDVQVGLGVLLYGGEEYGKAVDCFEAALASTESGTTNEPHQAHLLWNRLGATLANSGRSEEAIAAYEKALTLNPNFVRARYNLGVSCINIGVYEQAAQHLLGALSMHRVVELEGMQKVKEVMGDDPNNSRISDDEVERLMGMNQSTNLLETLRRVFGIMGRKDLSEKVVFGMDIEQFRGEFDF
ncbi:hypothetical protein ACLMJK_002726 [Lecanora helva]